MSWPFWLDPSEGAAMWARTAQWRGDPPAERDGPSNRGAPCIGTVGTNGVEQNAQARKGRHRTEPRVTAVRGSRSGWHTGRSEEPVEVGSEVAWSLHEATSERCSDGPGVIVEPAEPSVCRASCGQAHRRRGRRTCTRPAREALDGTERLDSIVAAPWGRSRPPPRFRSFRL